jgi:hypothetical protein
MTFLRKNAVTYFALGAELEESEFSASGVGRDFPINLKNIPTTLFQKRSSSPTKLAKPDVTVMT